MNLQGYKSTKMEPSTDSVPVAFLKLVLDSVRPWMIEDSRSILAQQDDLAYNLKVTLGVVLNLESQFMPKIWFLEEIYITLHSLHPKQKMFFPHSMY